MSRPFFVSSRRRLALAAGLSWLAGTPFVVSAAEFSISAQQRSTAQQVAQAGVPLSELAPNAPDTYTVKRGDTLWGISRLFLRSPWRWPELWGMNLEQVKNPHLIYPGQLLVLVKQNGQARLVVGQAVGLGGTSSLDNPGRDAQLRARVREQATPDAAITAVPMHLIGPFLNEAVVFDDTALNAAPRVVATQEGRVLLSRGEVAYVRGDVSRSRLWQIFRQPNPLKDPLTGEVLGYEARHVGTAELVQQGDLEPAGSSSDEKVINPSVFVMQQLREEVNVGDRLAPLPARDTAPFMPHAPAGELGGRVMTIYGDSFSAGQNQIVTINRGSKNGVERGHVLALWRAGRQRQDATSEDRATVQLPDERSGLLFVFRVFERVSYALVVQTQDPVRPGDRFSQP